MTWRLTPMAVLAAILAALFTDSATSLTGAPFQERRLKLVTAPEGNEARYFAREQLARVSFPSDAIGRTTSVTGTILIDANGRIVRDSSKFVIDLRTLTSDSQRRDNYLRRNTLQTEQHPNAEFVPTELRGLSAEMQANGEVTGQVVGDLTLRGVTRPTTWDVEVRLRDGAFVGTANTAFTFSDFELPVPRVASVLSVKDTIRLVYDFRLVPAN